METCLHMDVQMYKSLLVRQTYGPHTNDEALSIFYLINSEFSLLSFLVSLLPHNKLLLQQQKRVNLTYVYRKQPAVYICVVLQRLSSMDLDPAAVPVADFLLCFGLVFSASDKIFFSGWNLITSGAGRISSRIYTAVTEKHSFNHLAFEKRSA